ncbi:MAG: hypothetical protein ACYCWE_20810 [Eubacteriales bacterium]
MTAPEKPTTKAEKNRNNIKSHTGTLRGTLRVPDVPHFRKY